MNEHNIKAKIHDELQRLEEQATNIIATEKIVEVLEIFKSQDMDLIPILEIIEYAVNNIQDERVKSVILKKVIKFYGLGKEVDILKTRQKISIISDKLIKKPFLKKETIDNINTLLAEHNIL
jgi:hypothetical protein